MTKTTTYYKLTLRVPAEMVATIFEVLNGEGVMLNAEPEAATRRIPPHHKSPKKMNGLTGPEFALSKVKASGAQGITLYEIRDAFEKDGRTVTSSSPCLSQLKAEGKIKLHGDKWKLA